MENICSELRYLPVTQTLAEERALLILCDLSFTNRDAVEVAMVTGANTHGYTNSNSNLLANYARTNVQLSED